MRRAMIVAVLVMILGPGVLLAEEARGQSNLDAPCTITTGQLLALSVPGIVKNSGLFDGSMVAVYNKDKKKIELRVFGAKTTVDGAKGTLEVFKTNGLDPLIGTLAEMYGVPLVQNDFVLTYLNRYKDNQEIIRLEDGQYIIK